jgi:DNA-binding PadR family transcriptional regulator
MRLTRLEFQMLLTLVDGPRHGYAIMQAVNDDSGGLMTLGPGTLYTAVQRFLEQGLIEECAPDGDRRRCYRLTRKGKAFATEEAQSLSSLIRLARKRGLLSSTT